MKLMRISLILLPLLIISRISAATDLPAIKVAVLATGTVNWELQHIKNRGLDHQNGFNLVIEKKASLSATRLAFMSNSSDMMVSDWLWVADQNNLGNEFKFIPYSKQIGAVVHANTSQIKSITDLTGKTIGVAGGPMNKGWLLTQAAAAKKGIQLTEQAEVQFGAPPLMSQALKRGQVDILITFWHYAEKLKLHGYVELYSLSDAMKELGLKSEIPLLGYVVNNQFIIENNNVVQGFQRAIRQAKDDLKTNELYWGALRQSMRFQNEAEFTALKSGYIDGDPGKINQGQLDTAVNFYTAIDRYRTKPTDNSMDPRLFLELSE